MNTARILQVIFILSLTRITSLFALPQGPFPDAVFDKKIKTVQFYKEGWEFSYPIFDMKDQAPLQLSFDDLSDKSRGLNYVMVLCDADWMPSRLAYSEYSDGFYQNPLSQFESSFSTSISYTHYTVNIPNENVRPKLPGNYILLVFEDNEDNPILIKRFVVVDQLVNVEVTIKRPTLPKYQKAFQEVDFSILHPNYTIDNPHQTVNVNVVKNNHWKSSIHDLKPLFIRNDELVYDYEDKNLFPGGNEYRSFDIKSLKYQSANIQSIDFRNNAWHVTLKPDKPRDRIGYLYNEDFNGKYFIQNQQGVNAANDAEYVYIHLTFPMDVPLSDGDIFVYGGFSDYNCSDDYRMTYNYERKAYELTLLVKQGFYNYQYVYIPRNSSDIDETYFEGSFYETENDYVIYVYHRPFGARYDKLIGVKVVNSLKISN